MIDVGVFWADAAQFQMPPIGDDIPGDWNGYWFFKNTPGTFSQVGTEVSVRYQKPRWSVAASHSWVSIAGSTSQQSELAQANASMYLAYDEGNLRPKAFPEHVTRVQAFLHLMDGKLNLSTNLMQFSAWYSPIGTQALGGTLLNASVLAKPTTRWEVSLSVRNLLNENALYPMNSNAGGEDVSPGAPALESTTFWGGIRYKF